MWNTIIVQPISWLLLTLYELTSNYGLAIVLFTLIMKVVFLPFSMKGKKGMMAMQRFTPKLKELELKYKNDKEKYNLEVQKLYKKEKANPLSGCIWQLLPWPVFIALYDVIRRPLTNLMRLSAEQVTAVIENPTILEFLTNSGIDLAKAAQQSQIAIANAIHQNFATLQETVPELASTLVDIDFSFLGLNLSLAPVFGVINAYWFLPLISGAVIYLSTLVSQKMGGQQTTEQNQQMKMMTYMGPVMSIWIGYMWPAAMAFYWIANSGLGMIQDYFLTVHYRNIFELKDAERAKEDAAEREAVAKKKEEQAQRREQNNRLNTSNTSSKKYKKLKQMQATKPKTPKSSGPTEDSEDSEESKGATNDE